VPQLRDTTLNVLYRPATRDQVDDQHHHSQYQQDVDQASCNVKPKSQQPKNQQDRKNRPKHSVSPQPENWHEG
jgi:hypothetical protein